MAYTTVQDLFTGICDSIRAKEKTTAPINHQDIPTRIANLPTGSSACEVTKISIEESSGLSSIMARWASNSKMDFYLKNSYGDIITLSGKVATVFIMFKYVDNGVYYSFWVAGSATRGNKAPLGIGADAWGQNVSETDSSLTFNNDGTLFFSLETTGLQLTGGSGSWFTDIAGLAVSYDEGQIPSLGS